MDALPDMGRQNVCTPTLVPYNKSSSKGESRKGYDGNSYSTLEDTALVLNDPWRC